MRRLLAILPACVVVAAALAAPLSSTARSEIDGLMARLEASGCEFNRNGAWYSSTKAKDHLLGKLKYLEDRGAVQSAEQFIELAATASSMSGQPYLVRCGDGTPIPSAAWLLSQLQVMRSGGQAKRAP